MVRTQRRRIWLSVIVALALTAFPARLALAHGADANWVFGNGSCDQGELCIWRDVSFGAPFASTGLSSDNHYSNDSYPNNAGPLNDTMTSAWNRLLGYHVIFYSNADVSGTPRCFFGGEIDDNVGSFNDKASSHVVAVGGSC